MPEETVDTEQVEVEVEEVQEVVEPVARQMRNVNATDEEGKLLWHPRDYVVKLRGESQDRRNVIKERDTEITSLQQQLQERADADEQVRLTQLEENDQFKELATEWQNKHETLEQQLADQQLGMLRVNIANEFGLPTELADRLIGENEENIRQDAERLTTLFVQTEEEPQTPQQMTTTPVIPGNTPPLRDDAARHADYFVGSKPSSVFDMEQVVKHTSKNT